MNAASHRRKLTRVPTAPPLSTRPLVVISNRGPYALRETHGISQWSRTVGGLVSALDPAMRARGGVWIAGAEPGSDQVPPREVTGYEIATVALDADEMEGYYRRVANGVLWPLFHSFPTRVRTLDAPWDVYRSVNERFAECAARAGDDDAMYWVQDFQLTLVPNGIRQLRPNARIGWFNHVPFPAPEVFATLPAREELLDGLLGADLLGFQTARDVRNFLAAVSELTAHRTDAETGTIRVGDRVVLARAFPIGIDADAIQGCAADKDVRAIRERMRGEFGSQKILLSVDRLDYTKGMPERLHAFATFLEQQPQWQKRVSLVQVAVPSRTEVQQYARLKREVDELVGQINGRFGSAGWTPIHYLYRSFDLTDLVALYTAADVAIITPLRDGMNLVAHEFAASRLDCTGVLLLSEFAGAATVLDGAVLVNPYDFTGTANAIASALEMTPVEQEERMRRLRGAVRKYRIGLWQAAFLSTLEHEVGIAQRAKQSDRTGAYRRVAR